MEPESKPRYRPGDRVRVIHASPPGHHRTPGYAKGKTGKVAVVCGLFFNPETRAYGSSGLPKLYLYRVEFDQRDLWRNYKGPAKDKLLVDIFEHWLEPA